MKLQVALDELKLDEALYLIDKIYDSIDIIEAGTPFIYREGMNCVRKLKQEFPKKEILADLKVVDDGYFETSLAFESGASYTTVLALSDNDTISGCVKAAQEFRKIVFADFICVSDEGKRTKELEKLGIKGIAVHVGVDQQRGGLTPLESLKRIKKVSNQAMVSVAGGINSRTVYDYFRENPDILVVGGGITHASDPVTEAKAIKKAISEGDY